MFDIQEEITTPVKFWGKILFIDGIVTIIFFNYATQITELAYRPLQLPAIIFLLSMYLFWVFPSKKNKRKRHYHRLFYILFRNRQTYLSMAFYDYQQDEYLDNTFDSEDELELYSIYEEAELDDD
ncbi:hypothetical protein KUB85_001278 [Enterococcus faecalis]|nr:hypothetical protein [Enterococcus faecalis]EMC0698324.1 hypothetical protein [Enterococcus faecalis]